MIDEKYVKEYIGSILTVKDKWYYKIPFIGQRLYKKAKIKHSFQNNKDEIFDFINDILTKEIAYDDNCYKAILEEFFKNKRSGLIITEIINPLI